MAWTDEKRAQAIEMYLELNPTPENTMDCLKTVAETLGETQNGVRMILSKAEVYVKKEEVSTKTTSTKATTSTPKVSKADSLTALKEVVELVGYTVDEDVISKLTGKQAVYFTAVIKAAKSTNIEE